MKRRIAIVAGGLVAAAGLAVAPTLVNAEPPKDEPGGVPNATDLERAKSYWTVERMKNAEPMTVDAPKNVNTEKVAKGKPKVIKGTAAASNRKANALDNNTGGPWTGGGLVTKTVGKVFFTLPDGDYVCSGSVVPSDNKSTVLTAGHCVNDAETQPAGTPGEYASEFTFVPGYNGEGTTQDEVAPEGVWPAQSITAHTLWAANRGDGEEKWNYDVGFAQIAPQGGETIEDRVGSQSVAFNQKRGQAIAAFGYPAGAPYDGRTLQYCSDDAPTKDTGGTKDQRINCDLTGGSSGGPWFQNFNEGAGSGVQVSLNSFTYQGEVAMYGPYFGTSVQRLYEAVQD
jgi:V8-like Glu-specific endopeptidase